MQNNIKYLGIVSLSDVFSLIRNSLAIINPSFFEGWGNTLEHAIHLNKYAIVSNIDVHKERVYKNKILFDPVNYKQLAKIMINIINQKRPLKKYNKNKNKNEYNKLIENYSFITKSLVKFSK